MKKILSLVITSTIIISSYAQDVQVVAKEEINYTDTVSTMNVDVLKTSQPAAIDNLIYVEKPVINLKEGRYPSPYKTSWKVDAPIIVAGIGLTALGTQLIANKRNLTASEVRAKTKDNLPFFDRGNAGYYSKKADEDSYVPFHASFAWPVVMLLANKNERHNAFQVAALYVETMAVTGTLFTMATGTVYRSRPYVYDPTFTNGVDLEGRMDNDAHRSFFAGHTAATAAASFFTAKVFSDFNPDSKLKPVVWAVAAATPALVGYLRYKAGMHFLSDNLLGYAIGAAAGIYIPQLHKMDKMKNLSFVPQVGKDYKGFAFNYKF